MYFNKSLHRKMISKFNCWIIYLRIYIHTYIQFHIHVCACKCPYLCAHLLVAHHATPNTNIDVVIKTKRNTFIRWFCYQPNKKRQGRIYNTSTSQAVLLVAPYRDCDSNEFLEGKANLDYMLLREKYVNLHSYHNKCFNVNCHKECVPIIYIYMYTCSQAFLHTNINVNEVGRISETVVCGKMGMLSTICKVDRKSFSVNN